MTSEDSTPDGPVRLIAGRYRLRELLGRGGMGCVWRADDELLRRPVAVKELSFPPSLSPQELDVLRERTLREARAAARIDSTAAVRVYDVVEDEGQPWIVMELVEGRTLRDVIREDGPLSPGRTAQIGLALVDALEAAHMAGIVHRDVKPGNVLIRPDGRVTLTDFGIARSAGDPSITSTGLLLGSPSYISPERVRGGQPLPQSDMWSLGATLFTAVEGRPPFDRGEPFATLAAVVAEPPAPYFAAGPLAPVIDRLLDKNPLGRPAPAQARRMLASVAADPTNARVAAAATETAALAPAERTIVLPPAPRPTSPVATAPAPARTTLLPSAPPRVRPNRPVRDGRRSERLAGGLAVLLLVAGLGALAALLFLRGNQDPGPGAGRPATSSPTPTAGQSSSPSPSPLAVPPVAPARPSASPSATPAATRSAPSPLADPTGWVRVSDPAGWSFAHPGDWTPRARRGGTDYVDPDNGRYVRVDDQSPPVASAKGALLSLEKRFTSEHGNYSRIQLKDLSVPGYDDAAVWEWTYRDGSTSLHAVDLSLTAGNRTYALLFQSRDSDWASSGEEIRAFFASFRPAQ